MRIADESTAQSTEEAILANKLAKAMALEDIDEAFRVMGRFMDKHRYQISCDICNEFKLAGRVRKR